MLKRGIAIVGFIIILLMLVSTVSAISFKYLVGAKNNDYSFELSFPEWEDGYRDVYVGDSVKFDVFITNTGSDDTYKIWAGYYGIGGFSHTINGVGCGEYLYLSLDSKKSGILEATIDVIDPYRYGLFLYPLYAQSQSDLSIWKSIDIQLNVSGPPIGPSAQFDYYTDGLTLYVDASSSWDPDGGEIELYEWDFGDGTTSEGEITTYVYDRMGSYTVTLTVTDDEGDIDIASLKIPVSKNKILINLVFHRILERFLLLIA
jgi:hypothetical protein